MYGVLLSGAERKMENGINYTANMFGVVLFLLSGIFFDNFRCEKKKDKLRLQVTWNVYVILGTISLVRTLDGF